MATVNFWGAESGDTVDCRATGGTFSIQTSTVRTGTYALRTNPTGSGAGWVEIGAYDASGQHAAASVATGYTRFYFRYATKATVIQERIFTINTNFNQLKFFATLTAAGTISVYDANISLITTGATILSANTWYRIEVKVGTGASGAYELKIDGVSEVSGTADLHTNNWGVIRLGKTLNMNTNTVDYFYDDVLIDDAGFPGAGQSVVLLPNANGSTAEWTGGTNSSNYAEVDEVPHDTDTTYIKKSSAASQQHLVAFQDSSTISNLGTINSVKIGIRTREDSGGTASATFARIRNGSTDSDNSSNNGTTSYLQTFRVQNTDPNTSSAWSSGGLDSVEGGVVDTASVSAVRCTSVLLYVDYVTAAAGSGPLDDLGMSGFFGI